MMRILLVLVATALGSPGLGQSYYPSAEGMSWTYSSGETQQLSGPRELNGQQVMVLTHFFEGVPISEDYLVFGTGVESLGTAAGGELHSYSPALQVYAPSPLEVGQQWQSRTEVAGITITLEAVVLGVRGVQTPAGRFNALHIRQRTITSTGAQTILDLFFVPSVGIVRFVTGDGSIVDLIEKNF